MPPVAARVVEYPTFCVPFGSEEVVMLTGVPAAAMTMLKPCDAVWAGELESFTCTVIGNVPDCVGVPLIVPLETRVKPVGKFPELTTQLYGVFPPVAINALEYELPAVPEGSNVVVIDKVEEPDVIVIDNVLDADFAGELESVTLTVKLLDWAEALTVPLMIPLAARVKPAGKLPELTTQL